MNIRLRSDIVAATSGYAASVAASALIRSMGDEKRRIALEALDAIGRQGR